MVKRRKEKKKFITYPSLEDAPLIITMEEFIDTLEIVENYINDTVFMIHKFLFDQYGDYMRQTLPGSDILEVGIQQSSSKKKNNDFSSIVMNYTHVFTEECLFPSSDIKRFLRESGGEGEKLFDRLDIINHFLDSFSRNPFLFYLVDPHEDRFSFLEFDFVKGKEYVNKEDFSITKERNYLYPETNIMKFHFTDDHHFFEKYRGTLIEDMEKVRFADENSYKRLLQTIDEKISREPLQLFDIKNECFEKYKYRSLKQYNLAKVNFDNKNISGMDLSHNIKELHIDFSRIQKDLSGSSIRGYQLQNFLFDGWDLRDADVTKTSAGIDLLTCKISIPTKMSIGTKFDEENVFFFGGKEKTIEEVEQMGIKVYKKR